MADNISLGIKIDGVEKSINSIKDAKDAIKQLQQVAENSDFGSEEYKNALKQLELLDEKLKDVTQTEKQAAKATEEMAKAEKEATKETQDLRKQFEVLEDELFLLAGQGKQNTKEFRDLTIQAAALNKKIDEVNSTLGGGDADRAALGYGKLNEGLRNLDFKSVKEGLFAMKTAIAATGVMLFVQLITYLYENFDKLSKGSGGLAKALQFVASIISVITDGINWLTDSIGLTNTALDKQGEAIIKNAEKTKIALNEQIKGFDNQIAAAKAAGKSTIDLEIAKQKAIVETNYKIAEQLIAQQKLTGSLNEQQQKLFDESIANIKAAKAAENVIIITAEKEKNDKLKELNKERNAANLSAIKAIEDAQIAAIKNEEERLFAKEVLDNERRLKEIAAGKESEELKRQEREAQAILFEQNLAKINADAADKKKVADEKAAAEKKAAEEKELAKTNAENTAKAELAVLQKGNDLNDLINQLTVEKDIKLQNKELTESEIALIEEKYRIAKGEAIKTATEKEKALELAKANEILNFAQMSNQSHQALSDAFFAVKNRNLEKGSAAERKSAEQQFKVNKALAIQSAIITGIQGVMNALSAQSILPEPAATILRVATAVGVGIAAAANIAKIAATKFDAGGGGGGGGGVATPTAPPIPAAPTISTPEANITGTKFDESGKKIESSSQQPIQVNVKAQVVETEITQKQYDISQIKKQTTF